MLTNKIRNKRRNNNRYHKNTMGYKRILQKAICQQTGQSRRNGKFSRNTQLAKTKSGRNRLNKLIIGSENEFVIKLPPNKSSIVTAIIRDNLWYS